MGAAFNLGDLLDRSAPAEEIALIDCLHWDHPREYAHGEIDRLAARARAASSAGD
jgi:hypothetical protein